MKFPNLSRRGFIAAASALSASVAAAMNLPSGIKLLNETDNEEPVEKSKDWITDRGDYYIVHVPEGKTFKNEDLDKSTVFYLENYSTATNMSINGFVNIILLGEYSRFDWARIDTRNTRLASGKERAAMIVEDRRKSRPPMVFNDLHIQTSDCMPVGDPRFSNRSVIPVNNSHLGSYYPPNGRKFLDSGKGQVLATTGSINGPYR